ncbi:unnamed protein product, partial [Scytosiphon promiscuus]
MVGIMAKPKPGFTVGKNMDHPHLKGRFTLRIWIPVEDTALVIGKCGEIKQETSVRSIDSPVAPPGVLWSPVVITGDPTSSYKAYEAIAGIVDEVDAAAVAEFPLHLSRHPLIVGPKGATLKRISAVNAVRIMLPSEKDAAAAQQHQQHQHQQQHGRPSSSAPLRDKNVVVQLEGGVQAIFSALAMVMEAVYGCRATTLVVGGSLPSPTTQNTAAPVSTAASSPGDPPATGAGVAARTSGEGTRSQQGQQQQQQQQQQVSERGAAAASSSRGSGGQAKAAAAAIRSVTRGRGA